MPTPSPVPGSFCWFELATSDQPAAKTFYQSLFGWSAEDSPMGPDEVYTIFTLGGAKVAAAFTLRPDQRAAGVPPNWLIYVRAQSADETATRARDLGGTVLVQPFDVMDSGRMAVIQDPTGAVLGIWQPGTEPGIAMTGGVHTICWADLNTPDQSRGAAFYADLFGWRMVGGSDISPAAPGQYIHIMNGDQMQGGVPPATQRDPNAPPHWMLYVEVEHCGAMESKALSLGARVYVPTMAIGENGWMCVLADPQGAMFALHQA